MSAAPKTAAPVTVPELVAIGRNALQMQKRQQSVEPRIGHASVRRHERSPGRSG
jgi:hypothetical protein